MEVMIGRIELIDASTVLRLHRLRASAARRGALVRLKQAFAP
jgi:hypothetical protein